MTTKKARDFLDKELFVKGGIVTFRSLSRALGIHVNDAKNELQAYYDVVRDTQPAVPTYLVSGEAPALTIRRRSATRPSESAMDVDVDKESEEEDGEEDVVYQSKVLLVDACALDKAKSELSRVHSVHIYSLSPSRLGDAGLVCTPAAKVRETDARLGSEFFAVVGKITGSHVKLKDAAVAQSAASSSKSTLDVPAKVAPKPPAKVEHPTTRDKTYPTSTKALAPTVAALPKMESKDRPKPSGKLDWSKAKTKDKEQVAEKTAKEKKPKVEPNSPVSVVSDDVPKRGIKRKPLAIADPESESESGSESESAKAKPSAVAGSSVTKVVYEEEEEDDDDDDDAIRIPGKRRSNRRNTLTSDSEMSLQAMMDIDDEQVDRASRGKVLATREEEGESEEMTEPATVPPVTTEDEESDVPVKPRKRKPRKVVPVGRNGLKKRRVVKSRTTTDAKGYMQTEDYSSYESVEEEEEEPKSKGKGKGKAKETKKASESTDKDEVKPKVVVKEEGTGKPKAKPPAKSRGGASKRGGLLNFFGPERGKK